MPTSLADQQIHNKTRRTLRFIGLSLLVYVGAGLIAGGALRWLPEFRGPREAMFPRVFWVTSLLLIAGSTALHRAVGFVKLEKQREFRQSLILALVLGVLFVGLQAYGLKTMVDHQRPGETQTGSNAFLTAVSGLHAMHFTVALWWLLWVLLSAFEDRYDHEYYWGVTACGWFWHGLGIVWGAVLAVFLIASNFQ